MKAYVFMRQFYGALFAEDREIVCPFTKETRRKKFFQLYLEKFLYFICAMYAVYMEISIYIVLTKARNKLQTLQCTKATIAHL